MIDQKCVGFIQEEEWKEIVSHMYEEQDAIYLINKLMDLIKRKYIDTKPQIDTKRLTREEIVKFSNIKDEYKIPFPEFQKILLDFQLKTHDKYIKKFLNFFKKYDTDNNGILTEDEFISFSQALNVFPPEEFNENITRILEIVDPFNKQQVTFSQCIELYSLETFIIEDENGNKKEISFLDKIAYDDTTMNENK